MLASVEHGDGMEMANTYKKSNTGLIDKLTYLIFRKNTVVSQGI